MITAAQLSAARSQMARMLTDTCTHYAATNTVDDTYAESNGYAAGVTLPCLIYNVQGQRTVSPETTDMGDSKSAVSGHIFRFTWDAEVSVGDKLETSDGTEFLVVSSGVSDTNRFILQVGTQRILADKI